MSACLGGGDSKSAAPKELDAATGIAISHCNEGVEYKN